MADFASLLNHDSERIGIEQSNKDKHRVATTSSPTESLTVSSGHDVYESNQVEES
jgi:hypothetical protein